MIYLKTSFGIIFINKNRLLRYLPGLTNLNVREIKAFKHKSIKFATLSLTFDVKTILKG